MTTLGTFEKDNLIAGDFPIVTDAVTIATGSKLTRGTVLGRITNSGKFVAVDSSKEDGSQTPKAVLLEDVDATSADKKGAVALTGEFNTRSLVFGGTDTAATHKDALRALSIFVRDSVAK